MAIFVVMPEKDISSTKEGHGEWVLISEWFRPKDDVRWGELQRALADNLEKEGIRQVVLFIETEEGLPLDHSKLKVVRPSARPTYRDLFQWANANCTDCKVVLANNDISFAPCQWPEISTGEFLVGSRHEWVEGEDVWFDDSDYHFGHEYSADAWFFKTPVHIQGARFRMGQMGCDNRIAWLAHCSGNVVRNIGLEAPIRHYHASQVRPTNTRARVTSPYLAVAADGRMWSELKVGRRELVRSALVDRACFRFTLSYIFGGRAKVPKST